MKVRRAWEYYLALNPDVLLLPNYVASLVAALEANAQAGWGTGKLLLPDEKCIYSVRHALLRGGYAFNIGYGLPDSAEFAQSREVFGAPGAAVLLKDSQIDAVAPAFDEHIFLYAEDTDLDWRASFGLDLPVRGGRRRYAPGQRTRRGGRRQWRTVTSAP